MSVRNRRHIFPDGTVVYRRPSVITAVFPITYRKPEATKVGTRYGEPQIIGGAFNYYLDGNKLRAKFDTVEQAEFERKRFVLFAGGEVIPPELHLT